MSLDRSLRRLAVVAATAVLAIAFLSAAAHADKAPAENPPLWKIDGPKGDIYLFGSLQLPKKAPKWRTPAVEAALKETQVLVFEFNFEEATNNARVAVLAEQQSRLPNGQRLKALLTPDQHAKFETLAAALGLSPAALEPKRPWYAAFLLGLQIYQKYGLNPSERVDIKIWKSMRGTGKFFYYLEAPQTMAEIITAMPREREVEFLRGLVDQLSSTPDIAAAPMAPWLKGDVAVLQQVLNSPMDPFPKLKQILISDRHKAWMPKFDRMMADGRTHFVVIGIENLVGPDSIIAMLRAKGVKVEGP